MSFVRGQISFEYLVIVGVSILVIVPTLFFFLSFTGGGEDSVTHSRVAEIGVEMLQTASETYALGKHSWLTLDVNVPEAVETVRVDGDELVIAYATKHGRSEAVFFSDVPLQAVNDLPGDESLVVRDRVGLVGFRFESIGSMVNVSVSG